MGGVSVPHKEEDTVAGAHSFSTVWGQKAEAVGTDVRGRFDGEQAHVKFLFD